MGKLEGKVALITGGSDGIGLATAQRFVAEGAYVFITGRRKEALDLAVEKLGNANVTAIQADVTKRDDLEKMYQIISKEKGKLNVLFANAGASKTMPLASITEEHFDDLFGVNVKSVLFTVQKALPLLADKASIILNASVASIKGAPGTTVYCATKAAVRSFARCWSIELKDRQIRVNTISPGPIETSLLKNMGENEEQSKMIAEGFITGTVMGRAGQPDEVAKVVLFLASDDSSYITGIELFIDGGIGQI